MEETEMPSDTPPSDTPPSDTPPSDWIPSDTIVATVETFEALASEGAVLVDIWGPDCRPCLALMPAVETLAERYRGRVRVVKVNAPENRKVCRDLRVAGLPAYLTMRDGVEVERLTGNGTTAADIEEAIGRLLGGAPAVGLPVPQHLREPAGS